MTHKISFHGHSHAGKDTACLWFAAHTALRFTHSTSWFLAPYVAEELGIPVEWLRDERRHRYADDMFRIGNELRDKEPGIIIRQVLAEGDLISGLRDPREIDWVRATGSPALVVWIDRDVPDDPTMRLYGPEKCDIRVDNYGTKEEFHGRLARLARFAGIEVFPEANDPARMQGVRLRSAS